MQSKSERISFKHIHGSVALLWLLVMTVLTTHTAKAEGDQFLDGIGETALIARYVFDGNLDDWSRNALHADMTNGDAGFVEDDQFGEVLRLSGAAMRLPGQTLNSQQSLSIAGWIRLDNLERGQLFFDLGTDRNHRFSCTPVLGDDGAGLSVVLLDGNRKVQLDAPDSRLQANEWTHLAVVLDSAKRTMSLYLNAERVERRDDVRIDMEDVLNASRPKSNQLLIGGSLSGDSMLNGGLHDVRFYRIALSEKQVAVIHHNAISDAKWGDENSADESDGDYRKDNARQLTAGLTGVQDVRIETHVGQLPHLPYYLDGIYQDGAKGPKVRVIWPAPKADDQVRKAGSYRVTGQVPGTDFKPVATVVNTESKPVAPPCERVLESFPLGQVLLNPYPDGTPTPFMEHRDKFINGLTETDPNSFLYNFRDAFGQPQPDDTEPLYVWDSQTCRLRGHASGHYLTAIAQAYASTSYDPELQALFRQKMETMVDVLHELSQMSGKPTRPGRACTADPTRVPPGPKRDGYDSDLSKEGIRTDYWNWGEGFISAYPPDQFIMLEQGASYGTGNDQVWAPYYTLHKILAGLMDCYELGDSPKALEVARGMGLWVYKRLSEVSPETRIRMWNSYIAGEYGGMNEAMARLSRLTEDERFLECAKLFDNTEFFFGDADHDGGLVCNIDTIRGKHANQHIPQITGALETYRDTNDPDYYRVARNFWEMCTHSYMYSIGGVAGARNPNNAECFTAEPDTLFRNGLADGGQNETCATYNLLKLGRGLFMYETDAGFMDYYEQALYNHILASVAEHDAGNTYHVPLNPGAVKHFGNAEMNGFTCCNGTAIESATKLQNTSYLKTVDNTALYVNLYMPSTLDWKARGVRITQDTGFPYSNTINLTVSGKGEFALNLRVPGWATHGFRVLINEEEQSVEAQPGSYLALARSWSDGDTVTVKIPMGFHLMPLMDQPNIASIFYGPVLLAAEEEGARTDWRRIHIDPAYPDLSFSGDPATLHFEADDAHFKPFFEMYGHHSVYLDIVPKRKAGAYPSIRVIDPPEKAFFAKQLDFHGIPIKSSAAVDDRALHAAFDRLSMMLEHLPDARERLARKGAELHIIGRNEVTTDLPEFRDMKGVKIPEYGGQTYDERTRGLGGLRTSCGEENLLKLPNDRYRGSDICVHEFAHNIMNYGSGPEVTEQFEAQRKRSLEKGRWVESYAGSNAGEFFAELAMWYFGTRGDVRMIGLAPAAGPEGLKDYDPEAYKLVDDFWSGRLTH